MRMMMAAVAALTLAGCQYVPGTDARRIEEAKRDVAALLIDPTSPLFTDVRVTGDAVCGYVNGKNRFGAYVGATPFVTNGVETDIQPEALSDDARELFGSGFDRRCDFDARFESCMAGVGGEALARVRQACDTPSSEGGDMGITDEQMRNAGLPIDQRPQRSN